MNNPRKSAAAASLAAFAESGKPKSPFERALRRAWERIEGVITEEFITVLHEENAAAVGKATIERWERGLRVPRLPMLFDWVQALELALVLQVAGGPAAAVIFRTAERAP